ncbi:MAG TPA: HupE/UreJ family protein [Woeseiaceae bacterium]|nr:HupE/UreJ family protein [Woeseiaceae bacterium]
MTTRTIPAIVVLLTSLLLVPLDAALAHNVSDADAAMIAGRTGWHFYLYVWLGAKHMVTGYDHLLFLVGVIFYLREIRSIATFVSLFALGHSITLIAGVLLNLDVNAYLVDAIIGLSVAYKGFDNLNGFTTLFGDSPNEKLAVLIFGLFHGLGLATKLQDLGLAEDGLLPNLVSFNIGVELGQLTALIAIVFILRVMPSHPRGSIVSTVVNFGLIVAGAILVGYQLTLYATA